MPGWLNSAGSGLLTWMLSNATSTAWISQRQRKGRQGEDDTAQTANETVGVGIMIAHKPLHGSGQAALPHPALALGDDAHAAQGIGMTDRRPWQPTVDEAPHTIPEDTAVLTAPRQRAMPEPSHLEPKDPQRVLVQGHSAVPDVSTHHRFKPLALFGDGFVHPSLKLGFHLVQLLLRMTRGRCGSLLHFRMTFVFTTPRRFNRRTGETK